MSDTTNVVLFPVVRRERDAFVPQPTPTLVAGPFTPLTPQQDLLYKTADDVADMAINISCTAGDLTDTEAKELQRHFDKFHRELTAIQRLVAKMTAGRTKGK